jgi:hypothetical protein
MTKQAEVKTANADFLGELETHVLFEVQGDSMANKYNDKDVIVCRLVPADKWSCDLDTRFDMVIVHTTHGILLRHIRNFDRHGLWLHANDPNIDDLVVDFVDISQIYYVIKTESNDTANLLRGKKQTV